MHTIWFGKLLRFWDQIIAEHLIDKFKMPTETTYFEAEE